MPNIKSVFKNLRQNRKRNLKNNGVLSELHTLTKKFHALVASKSLKEADTVLRTLESKLARAAKSDVIKKTNASRRVSRLKARLAKSGK